MTDISLAQLAEECFNYFEVNDETKLAFKSKRAQILAMIVKAAMLQLSERQCSAIFQVVRYLYPKVSILITATDRPIQGPTEYEVEKVSVKLVGGIPFIYLHCGTFIIPIEGISESGERIIVVKTLKGEQDD